MDGQPAQIVPPQSSVPEPAINHPQPQAVPSKNSMKLPLLIIAFIVLVAGASYAAYAWQHSKVTSLDNKVSSLNKKVTASNKKVASLQSQLAKLQPSVNNDYRGGTSGVKLTESVNDEISQTMNELATYKQQVGQFPESDTAIMSQNYWRYGYDGKAAGPAIKCPQDIGYISYSGYTNPTTHKIDQFDLYYCNGSSVEHKTQANLTSTSN